jgi:hypothetical protein
MGRLTSFTRSLAFIATYNIRPAIILQGHGQLVSAYGDEADNIDANMHTLIFGATNDAASQRFFSEMMGRQTYAEMHHTPMGKQINKSGANLLDVDQVRRISETDAVILRAGEFPIPTKKLAYYRDDSAFATRVRRTDFASDRIPVDNQITTIQRERLHREYLEMVARDILPRIAAEAASGNISASEATQRDLLRQSNLVDETTAGDITNELSSGAPNLERPPNATPMATATTSKPTAPASRVSSTGVRIVHSGGEFAKELRELEESLRVREDDDEAA